MQTQGIRRTLSLGLAVGKRGVLCIAEALDTSPDRIGMTPIVAMHRPKTLQRCSGQKERLPKLQRPRSSFSAGPAGSLSGIG